MKDSQDFVFACIKHAVVQSDFFREQWRRLSLDEKTMFAANLGAAIDQWMEKFFEKVFYDVMREHGIHLADTKGEEHGHEGGGLGQGSGGGTGPYGGR